MTYYNQTKELTTWFLNFSLDESIDNKSTKFESQIQDRMKHTYMTKSQRKAQEGHLEEGEAARPTKDTKSGKTTKRARINQNQHSH
jgi:hypothetical protein